MRLARHAYGGTTTALLESDDPKMIDTFRHLEPSIRWVQFPRCLFAAAQQKGHVMAALRSKTEGSLAVIYSKAWAKAKTNV